MIVYASKFGFRFKGSHPGGAGAVRRLRGHNVRSKALSVTLTRDTSPGVRGFKLVYFTPVNSRLSMELTETAGESIFFQNKVQPIFLK